MKTIFKSAVIFAALMGAVSVAPVIQAETSYGSAAQAAQLDHSFVKKRYKIKGSWSVDQIGDQTVINFNDDFKTKSGPDLKIYLSSHTIAELESGGVENTSLKISVLKSNSGAQSYVIPENINLSDYKSVVIHCEAFSVLWGGFDLFDLP